MVYIGIVSFRSYHTLRQCLDCVRGQTYKPIRVIVFDNHSDDQSVEWLKKQRDISLIVHHTNIGFGMAHNAIIRSLSLHSGDYYMPLNPDAYIEPGYIAELVRLCKIKHAQWATGKLYKNKEKTILYSVGHAIKRDGYAFNIGYGLKDAGDYAFPREVFGAPGAASLISEKMIHTLSDKGMFYDPNMFMYYEDIDIDWRARLMGFHCWYSPKSVAVHSGRGQQKDLEVEALGNRYVGVLKNASFTDLLVYNIPVIFFHCVFRLVFSPKEGWRLLYKLFWCGFASFTHRSKRVISRRKMDAWFSWSSKEATRQPERFQQRARSFFARHPLFHNGVLFDTMRHKKQP